MKPLSVITVCYNDKSALKRTLESVRRLSRTVDLEHIIVDGASTDGTVELIQDLPQGSLSWISEPDQGIFDAFNKGIAMSSGEWVHFLNAGDIYTGAFDVSLNDIDERYNFLCFSVLKRKRKDFIWKASVITGFSFVNVAHPGLMVRRAYYNYIEKYRTDLKFVSDSWFIWHNVDPIYALMYDTVLVDMEDGGYSTKFSFMHEIERQKLIFSMSVKLHIKVSASLKYLIFGIWRFLKERW